MVTNVVKPAITSVFILVLWAFNLNNFSIKVEKAEGVVDSEFGVDLFGVDLLAVFMGVTHFLFFTLKTVPDCVQNAI